MTTDSICMSTSVKSYPFSMADKSALNKEEILIKNDKLTGQEKWHNVRLWFYNPRYRQVCGRDGLEWTTISFSYFLLFMSMASIFALFFGIFMAIVDKSIPSYRGNSSVFAWDTSRPNPGLGFRPQISIEKTLIKYRSSHRNSWGDHKGWGVYKEQLDQYLAYYTEVDIRYQQAIDCNGLSIEKLRQQFYQGKSCLFDINVFNKNQSPCTTQRNFEYDRGRPCILLKLNKIYDWEPITYQNAAQVPEQIKALWTNEFSNYILVQCNGENDVDRDFIYEIEYFSQMKTTTIGGFHRNFFSYVNQDGYRSPLVFVYFKRIETNVLINVECRAYAQNIDHNDSLEYKTGSVHFELIVE
ncbi:unnamed protein product [Rotaria sordida]|uniref:Sodium/potassium-transporting ATPase subunit beta n=1 Tax=Rotaria sordida TaxID=392033 RepID=A0A819F7F3_9BILA|nr:unnamed protein product [Rotaria sordida]CAF3861909.1 unnamed protein product [Rotaria sordida]